MKKAEESRQGGLPAVPTSEEALSTSSNVSLGRSLSANRKDMKRANATSPDSMAPMKSPHAHSGNLFSALPSAVAPLNDAAASIVTPLNDAAASIVSLVSNSVVPTFTKAFARKKGKDGEEEGDKKPAHVSSRAGQIPSAMSDDSIARKTLDVLGDERSNVVMGVLSKWINLGRGWGPRLFVLEGGVLSYYKVEGPEKVSVCMEMAKHRSTRLVGLEIGRCIQKEKEKDQEKGRPHSFSLPNLKPLGTIHLLVANLRASKSDEKKFYIYSGTKTLDLRAESTEDRALWLEILEAAKLRMDASMKEQEEIEESRSAAMGAVREDAIGQLLVQLKDTGMGAEKMAEFEEVLRNDIMGALQQSLKDEQLRRVQLQRRVKELETEKVQLETAVVQETQSSSQAAGITQGEGDGDSDTLSDNEGEMGGEEEDGEDNFFEALSDLTEAGNARIDASSSQRLSMSLDMEKIGFDYPVVERRTKLPDPVEVEKPVSLWTAIKDCVGKDVSKITLPVYFNEPISTLQKCAEEMEYSWLLDRAAVYGDQGNQLMRALHVAAFALSGYACTEGRPQKPFNPLLGETFEADYPDKGWRFFSEKMVHNPNLVACHCEGQGWTFWGDCNMKIRFWGPSMQLDPLGVLSVKFDDGEVFEWSKVTTGIYNLILGKLDIDHYGTMNIVSNRNGMSVRLKFKERSMWGGNLHQVHGFAQDKTGEKLATLIGKWDEHLHFVMGVPASVTTDQKELVSQSQLLWRANARSEHCGKYKFTPFCVTLNEITPGLQEHLPPSDSRLRPDQRLLELGEYDKSNAVKLVLEQKQRDLRKSEAEPWRGRWFEQKGPHNTWTSNGKYWEHRKAHDWSIAPDLFSLPPSVSATPSLASSASLRGPSLQRSPSH